MSTSPRNSWENRMQQPMSPFAADWRADAHLYPPAQYLLDIEFPPLNDVVGNYDRLCRQMRAIPRNTEDYELCRQFGDQFKNWSAVHVEMMNSVVALSEILSTVMASPTPATMQSAQRRLDEETRKIDHISTYSNQLRESAPTLDTEIMLAAIARQFLEKLGAKLEIVHRSN